MASPRRSGRREDGAGGADRVAGGGRGAAASAGGARIYWPYENFPARPAKVAERREVAEVGATFVRFANGVRLTVDLTSFRDDEVLVRVNVGQKLLSLPKGQQSPFWAVNAMIEEV